MALSQTVLQIGDEFRALQETRVKTYASLQEAHKAYLKSAPNYDFKVYQKEVAKATDAFNDISQQIIGLQSELGDSELAPFLSQVQDLERRKLHLTVQCQLAKQKSQDNDEDEDLRLLLKRLTEETNCVVEEINITLEEIRYFLADLRERQ